MRQDIKDYMKVCPYCNITYHWRRRGSEMLFYWRVISPFSILHVDLWCLEDSTNYEGQQYILKTIRDVTQFVVCAPVPDYTSTIISKCFM